MPVSQTLPIKMLEDKEGNLFFPRTHTKAVKNDDGVNLETLLSKLRRVLKTDAQIEEMISQESWEQDVIYYTVEE